MVEASPCFDWILYMKGIISYSGGVRQALITFHFNLFTGFLAVCQ